MSAVPQLWDTTPVTIRLSNGDSFTPALVPFQPTFFGVTSTEPIRWIEIGHHRSVLNLDNFADAAAPVPEPQTLTLLGLGIAGMAARRWRKRHPV